MNYISKIELDGSTAPIGSSLFGVCETAADESRKYIDIPEFDRVQEGTTVFVQFKYGNTCDTMGFQIGQESSIIWRWVKVGNSTQVPIIEPNTVMSFTYSSESWYLNQDSIDTIPICNSEDANKIVHCREFSINNDSYFILNMKVNNTAQDALTLTVNDDTAKPIYINNIISSANNYQLPSGLYIVYYDGTNYYFNTDGSLPNLDTKFVKKTGDTMSGGLTLTSGGINVNNGSIVASNWLTIGNNTDKITATQVRSMNKKGVSTLFVGSVPEDPHVADEVHVPIGLSLGVMYNGTNYSENVIYRLTNLPNSPTYLKGYDRTNTTAKEYTLGAGAPYGGWFSSIPVIDSNGVMEIGRYVDFHNSDTDTSNYTFRVNNTQDGKLSLSGTVNQGSSRKIKENIEDISLDEAKNILNLRPVRFDYITGSKDERGFIAEEVAEIYPNLVAPENEEFQIPASLNYIGIIPYLVKVIQDQEKRLNEQEKRIKELEK